MLKNIFNTYWYNNCIAHVMKVHNIMYYFVDTLCYFLIKHFNVILIFRTIQKPVKLRIGHYHLKGFCKIL